MRYFLLTSCIVSFFLSSLKAQELFLNAEPASTIPKGVLGVRAFDETYKEVNLYRNLYENDVWLVFKTHCYGNGEHV